jgi:glycosyltransferase involved in cell wall biosynthesis
MRILIATGLYAPQIGGPATYTAFLEAHLAHHGITPTVLPFSSVAQYPRFLRHLVYAYKLIRLARAHDVLYALDTVSVGVPVLCAHMLTRVPYLLRVPGDYAWEQGQIRFGVTDTLDEYRMHAPEDWRVRVLAWLQSCVARRALHVVVPSEYLKSVVMGWGVPQERITRIYSALKEVSVREARGELRAQYGYDGLVITSAARLTPWKGMRVLIDAVYTLRKEGLPVSLEIMGDGVCATELNEYVMRLGAGDYIHLRGSVSREELAKRIKASDAFVLNTAYEGLSHQLIEVMHLEVPIITTPVGGNRELITDQVDGLLVPFNNGAALTDALMRYINDQSYAKQRAIHARGKTKQFHEDVIISDVVRFFNSVAHELKRSL